MNHRILKFRVWDIINKAYTYYPNKQFLIGLDGRLYDGNGSPYDEIHIIQQFTELKDKNGKEVYEGDIIKLHGAEYKYEVVWNHWQWGIDSKGVVSDFVMAYTGAIEDRAIVIGNVFENPDLLK